MVFDKRKRETKTLLYLSDAHLLIYLFIYLFIFGTDFVVTSCRDLSVGDAVLNYQNLGSCRQDLSDGLSHVRLTTHLFIHQCPSHHASLYSPMSVSPRISWFSNVHLTTHLLIHQCPSHHASLYSPMSISPRISLFTNVHLTTHLFIHQCLSHHASLYSQMSISPRISLFTNVRLTTRLFIHQSSLMVEGGLETV